MAQPPSYEESTSEASASLERKGDRKSTQPWSIREQVGLSRNQHVASIVAQVVDHIRERALQGLSKTTMILIPSDQGSIAQKRTSRYMLNESRCQPKGRSRWLPRWQCTDHNTIRGPPEWHTVLVTGRSSARATGAAAKCSI